MITAQELTRTVFEKYGIRLALFHRETNRKVYWNFMVDDFPFKKDCAKHWTVSMFVHNWLDAVYPNIIFRVLDQNGKHRHKNSLIHMKMSTMKKKYDSALKCEDCGSTDSVEETICPYNRDVNGIDVPVVLCAECNNLRVADI